MCLFSPAARMGSVASGWAVMKRLAIVLPAMFLTVLPGARAGLYIPGEPPELIFTDGNVQPLPFNVFQLTLHDTLGIANPGMERHKEVAKKVTALQAKGIEQLRTEELASLSAYLVRLRSVNQALDL